MIKRYNSEGEPLYPIPKWPGGGRTITKPMSYRQEPIELKPEMIVFGSDSVGSTGIKPSVTEMDDYCRRIRAESLAVAKLAKMERYLKAHRHELALRGEKWERRLERYKKFLAWEYKVKI